MQERISRGKYMRAFCLVLAFFAVVPVRVMAQNAADVPEIIRAVQNQDHAALKRLLDAKADPDAEYHYYANQSRALEWMQTIHDPKGNVIRVAEPKEIFSTPLRIAIMNGDIVSAKLLLDAGAKVDKADVMGGTPLMEAQNVEMMRLLIAHGANVNAQASPMGFTPLLTHMKKGLEVVRLLAEHGADVNLGLFDGTTPLMRVMEEFGLTAMFETKGEPVKVVKLLLEHGASLTAKTRNGETVLMIACMNHAPLEFVRLCIKAGLDVNAQNKGGYNALEWNVEYNFDDDTTVTQFLLEKGANPNTRDVIGESPLKRAVYDERIHTVTVLLKFGAKPDVQDASGATPLLWAVGRDNPALVAMLVKAKANVNLGDKGGKTPLLWACSKGNPKIVSLLLAHGADFTVPTHDGRTALQIARTQKHLEIVALLLKAGAKR